MDKSGADAYVYAKSASLLKKAWISERAISLFNVESLSSLWNLIFLTPEPSVPELMLANTIEIEAVKGFVKDYEKLLEMYDKPEPFLVELLRQYDVENLKAFLSAIDYGEEKHPRIVRLGDYSVISYDGWPDIKKITEHSRFAWVAQSVNSEEREERQKIDYKLDLQMFKTLWQSLCSIKGESREVLKEYFSYEWSVKNLIWALRLKVYYNFSDDKIIENLYYVGDAPSAADPLCRFAWEIFGKKIDSYEEWADWRFSEYLNPREEGGVWKLSPMWVEQRFRSREAAKAKRLFHQYPMTDVSLAMFFCLKRQELNCIRAATESLRLGTDKKEAMYVAGISDLFEDGENVKNY